MAKREVTVVINGEEYVSKAAKEAEQGLDGFAGFMQKFKDKLIPVVDVTRLVEWAVRAMSTAFTAAKTFVLDSIRAYDDYVSAQVKLNAQSRLTGMSMSDMNKLVDEAKKKFGLGTVAAVDITAAVAKFASQAGKSADAGKLMSAALELGAASGQTAAQVAEGLSSALAGNDEWLNRLGLANPSGLYEEFAKSLGTTGSKLDDTQKKLAIMTAIMDAGNKVTGVYAERLQSAAGLQDRLNNNLDTAKVMFGAAIQPIRVLVVQGLTALLNVIGPLVIALGYLASGITQAVIAPFALARSAVGSLMEAFGKLTGNKQLEEWGAKQSQVFVKFTDDVAKWLGLSKPATDATTQMGKAHQLAAVQITATADATGKAAKSSAAAAVQLEADAKRINAQLTANLGPPLRNLIGLTDGALQALGDSAREQLDAKVAEEFQRNVALLRDRAGEARERIEGIKPQMQDAAKASKSAAEDVADIARAGLDAAQAFGVMNDEAASTLNSVINLGVAIAKVAGDNPMSSIPGIIASAANIISKMIGGDAERRRLIAANTEAMKGLRDRIGDLSLDVTGEDFAKIQTALQSVVGNLRGGRGAQNQADVFNALRRVGLGFGDLKKLADQLGIQITSQSGALSVDGIRQLLEAMGLVELGQFGNDYASQLQATRAGFDINQLDARGQLASLFRLGGNFAFNSLGNALDMNDLAGTRTRLAGLFERMNAGGLSAAELGGLTGSQFLDLISDLILRIDDLMKDAADAASGDTVDVPGVGAVSTGGAAGTVQEKITEQTTAVTDVLKAHTALHTRIAEATERTADGVERIEQLLIEASRGGLSDAVDRELESSRRALAAQQGTAASF
jgi:hypothetical protein